MRDLTEYELEQLGKGICPMCGSETCVYEFGARGGAAVNIRTGCGCKINVPDPREGLEPFTGQVIEGPPPKLPPKKISTHWTFFAGLLVWLAGYFAAPLISSPWILGELVVCGMVLVAFGVSRSQW